MTIPASNYVTVNPGVIGAGGNALIMNGLLLTNAIDVPIGAVQGFANQLAVASFFGPNSLEAAAATNYFAGFDNSTQKPGNLLVSQYPTASIAAYLRGGSLAAMTLAQLQAIAPGTLSITVNGVLKTTTSVDLSTATSFSDAATKISAGFTGGPVVAYNSQHAGFTFTSSTTGAASTITYGSGALATALSLTQALGAVTSQGSVAYVPGAAMTAVSAITQNWAAMMTTFEPSLSDKTAFGTWFAASNSRYAYVAWDTDTNAIVSGGGGTAYGTLNLGGSIAISGDAAVAASLGVTLATLLLSHAAFVLGSIASVDFSKQNGRITFAYKSQSAIVPAVTDATKAANLEANGYNYYGSVATANAAFQFFYPGIVGGAFKFIDEYVNEIWLNTAFQSAMLTLLTNIPSIPYNAAGKTLIEAGAADPIQAGVNFGAIRSGVTLSASQKAQVNAAAGLVIDTTLFARGWYLQVLDASPSVRAARGSPPCSFWYMDGGSVHKLNLSSVVIQ